MRTLIVVAKAPLPGLAKTRLARAAQLDVAFVARLADAFLRDTLRNCRRAAPADLVLCFEPADSAGYFRSLDAHARLVPQSAGDLGSRMHAAFEQAFERGAQRAVMIGGDTPHLAPEMIDEAFARLDRSPAVIGPASDGGFYLLGLREPDAALFERVEWSTPRVLAQTEERARERGLELARLSELFDVDEPGDLAKLRRRIAEDPDLCPSTARVLSERFSGMSDVDAG